MCNTVPGTCSRLQQVPHQPEAHVTAYEVRNGLAPVSELIDLVCMCVYVDTIRLLPGVKWGVHIWR